MRVFKEPTIISRILIGVVMQGQSDIIAQDPGSCTRFLIQRHELKSHRVLGFFPPLSFPFLLRWSGLNQVPLGGTALLVVSKAIKNAFRGETISIFTHGTIQKWPRSYGKHDVIHAVVYWPHRLVSYLADNR